MFSRKYHQKCRLVHQSLPLVRFSRAKLVTRHRLCDPFDHETAFDDRVHNFHERSPVKLDASHPVPVIDDVLEVNAEEFVRSFVQKGGQ